MTQPTSQAHTFKDAYSRSPAAGWLTEPEAQLLWETARATEGWIVEVGSYQGRSTCLLAQLHWPLLCIDPWDNNFDTDLTGDEVFARFRANIKQLREADPRVDIHVCRGLVGATQPIGAGFVYLDGDHTFQGTTEQISFALRCRPQAIAAHDVNDSGAGNEVKRACLDLLGPWQQRVERLAVWYLKK